MCIRDRDSSPKIGNNDFLRFEDDCLPRKMSVRNNRLRPSPESKFTSTVKVYAISSRINPNYVIICRAL